MTWEYDPDTGVWWLDGTRYAVEPRSSEGHPTREGRGSGGFWFVYSPVAAHEATIHWNIGQGNDAQSRALTLAKSVAELLLTGKVGSTADAPRERRAEYEDAEGDSVGPGELAWNDPLVDTFPYLPPEGEQK